jgi:hypothetical protein
MWGLRCCLCVQWCLRDWTGKEGELICQLLSWIGWIGENTGRKPMGKLAATGGGECEMVRGVTEIVKPSFLKLQVRQGGKEGGLRDRGNVLTYVGGERMAVAVKVAMPARELGKLVGEKGGGRWKG